MFDPTHLSYLFFGCCGGGIIGLIVAFIIAAWVMGSKGMQDAVKVVENAEKRNA